MDDVCLHDCVAKAKELEEQSEQLRKNTDLKMRLREQERCKMRRNLRIKCLKEEKDENIRA